MAGATAAVHAWSGILHNPLPVVGQTIGVASGQVMVALSCSNNTVHHASVNGDTPTKLCCNASKEWAVAASGGRPGLGRVPVCVERIFWPFAT
jgi:hypothetical protein